MIELATKTTTAEMRIGTMSEVIGTIKVLLLRGARQLYTVKRFERVNRIRRLCIHTPFEKAHLDSVGEKVCHRESVLLDWGNIPAKIKVRRWSRADAATPRRPTRRSRSHRPRQHRGDGICLDVLRAASQDRPHSDRMQVSTNNKRCPVPHRSKRTHESVVLCQPARLPVWLAHCGRQLAICAENIRIPLAPLSRAPARRTGWCMHEMRGIR